MNSWHIAWLLIRRTLGRRKGIISYLLLPALVVILAVGLLGGVGTEEIRLEVVNRDQGALGRLMIQAWEAHPEFRVEVSASEEEAQDSLESQKSDVILIIPESFTEELLASKFPKVQLKQLRYNEAVLLTRNAAQYEITLLARSLERIRLQGGDIRDLTAEAAELYQEKGERGARVQPGGMPVYSDQRITTSFGMLIMFLMLLVGSSVGIILDDKRNQTLQRIYASPVKPIEISWGNFLGCFMLGTIQIIFVMLVTRLVMNYDFGSAAAPQFLVLECFLLAALGIAAAVSVLMRDSEPMNIMGSLIITPTCMLGGCFWPMEIMPESMQKLANFVPQKWAIEALSKLAAGGGLGDIVYHMGILVLFGAVLLSFGLSVLLPGEQAGRD